MIIGADGKEMAIVMAMKFIEGDGISDAVMAMEMEMEIREMEIREMEMAVDWDKCEMGRIWCRNKEFES